MAVGCNRETSDGTFKKREHILKTREFSDIYSKGRTTKEGPFVLRYLENNLGYRRLGFSLSSRHICLSSRRNRVKRLFREVFRHNKNDIKNGIDLVIVVRGPVKLRLEYQQISVIFFNLLRKASLCRGCSKR